ncbi:hypothetical protein FHR83_007098 [Actinoplanes campanulatus]|uniref:Phage Mu protein F like protein n=1 Tax=Actinoplanes campanulatus TaxID=113559 RepID=A0A7W5AN74_9ACTN|nr:hypothetical protein [Actinoplanes campanulatus]MBB3099392.1 hypothetical protein [Actinoplanes campanulatus]GGN40184.1 hypothetical protein GCM10010109_68940 [Actinoplanes campanulatus]GID42399.1 hypothetical protein Aca09nite_89050 [Actinoplanes campanulatus]
MAASRADEAERAAVAYNIALNKIGATTVQEAIKLWGRMPTAQTRAVSAAWLNQALKLISTQRGRSRELALAYYRLVRALRTGKTVADPYHPIPSHVTLADLRREFATLAGQEDDDQGGGDTRVEVEKLPGLGSAMDRIERASVAEARDSLINLGPRNYVDKIKAVDTSKPAVGVDAARETAHKEAGNRQAASAARLAMNGARSTVWVAHEQDGRAIGYVRLSRTGTPCGFCAMLISRGAAYKSERAATYADGDLFHDNCMCYAEPVFSKDQFGSGDLYALNRQYSEQWPEVTKGLSGRAALSAWRRFIRQEQKASAQAARSASVQEA